MDKAILIIGDTIYPDGMGGSHRHMYELCKNLRSKGYRVAVITSNKGNKLEEYEVIEGIEYYRYARNDSNIFLGIIDFVFGPYKKYKQLSKMIKFSTIHGHWPLTNLLIFFKERKNTAIKKIYTFHGPIFEEYAYEYKFKNKIQKSLFLGLLKFIEKKVLKYSNKIIVASEYMKGKVKTHYGFDEKVSVIPVPTDINKFQPFFKDKTKARKYLQLNEKLTLFTVRRLQKRMGLDNLIYAFKKVRDYYPNVQLVIGGKGPYKKHLVDLCEKLGLKDDVLFTGFIPEEKLASYYEAADLFIMPSIDLEGFGLATTEAMSMGTLVVATPIGGNKEILSKYNKDYLTDSTNPEDISRKIIRIIKENNFKFSYCKECREFVIENYSWEKNLDKILLEYNS